MGSGARRLQRCLFVPFTEIEREVKLCHLAAVLHLAYLAAGAGGKHTWREMWKVCSISCPGVHYGAGLTAPAVGKERRLVAGGDLA